MVDYFPVLHEEKLISLIAFLEEAASAMGQLIYGGIFFEHV